MYKRGMIVQGIVTGILDYGVFVTLDDETKGLVHITKVRSGFVQDLHDYFRIGDVIKGEVVNVDRNGRIEISTAAYPLPNYTKEEVKDSPFAKLQELTLQTTEQTQDESDENVKTNEVMADETTLFTEALEEVFGIIETIIAESLSTKAKSTISKDVQTYGLVKYVMALGKKEHFVLDKALAFHQLVMEDVKIDLRTLHFTVSDHAIRQWCSERFGGYNEEEKAVAEIKHCVSHGVMFRQNGQHLYIRSGDYIFPCAEEKAYHYCVKTILTPELFHAQLNQQYKKPY